METAVGLGSRHILSRVAARRSSVVSGAGGGIGAAGSQSAGGAAGSSGFRDKRLLRDPYRSTGVEVSVSVMSLDVACQSGRLELVGSKYVQLSLVGQV
jgi:hypothetical protein